MSQWHIEHGPGGWSVVHDPDPVPATPREQPRTQALPDEMRGPKAPSKPDEMPGPEAAKPRRPRQ